MTFADTSSECGGCSSLRPPSFQPPKPPGRGPSCPRFLAQGTERQQAEHAATGNRRGPTVPPPSPKAPVAFRPWRSLTPPVMTPPPPASRVWSVYKSHSPPLRSPPRTQTPPQPRKAGGAGANILGEWVWPCRSVLGRPQQVTTDWVAHSKANHLPPRPRSPVWRQRSEIEVSQGRASSRGSGGASFLPLPASGAPDVPGL